MKKKVTIVQRRLTHYRVAFFQSLRKVLEEREIELQLLIGVGTQEEKEKNDSGNISWAKQIATKYFFKNKLCWQPIHKYLSNSDLVIVTQENTHLANLLMILIPRKFRLAFWGHGANLQSQHPNGIRERYKRWTTKRVDWWFAYSQLSAKLILETGFPAGQLTVVNNSIDTADFYHQLGLVSSAEIQSIKSSLGMTSGFVGVYIGSLYAVKRLNFLFSAAESIRNKLPTFNLLIIGDGPERCRVESFCEKHSWAHWTGALHGRKKAQHIASADVMLNPGAVGLGILDSFASQVPILTTDCKTHGPEIAYMENWSNGVMTSNSIDEYVKTAIKLLGSPESLNILRNGCKVSAELFTVKNMVNNFANGISSALSNDNAEFSGNSS